MKGTMYIIHPDGRIESIPRDRNVGLEELQAAVGGYIEMVPDWNTFGIHGRCVAWCNEEGIREGLPVNVPATNEWRADLDRQKAQHGIDYDPARAVLVGPIVVLVGDDEFLRS